MPGKTHLIEAITELNPSASPHWLASFDDHDLEHYYQHLLHAQEPRGSKSFWQGPYDKSHFFTYTPAA